jgi:hypothetical protein
MQAVRTSVDALIRLGESGADSQSKLDIVVASAGFVPVGNQTLSAGEPSASTFCEINCVSRCENILSLPEANSPFASKANPSLYNYAKPYVR